MYCHIPISSLAPTLRAVGQPIRQPSRICLKLSASIYFVFAKRNIAAVRIIFLRLKKPSTTKLHFLESLNEQSPASQFNVVLFGLDRERLIKESSRTELTARLDELRYKH